MKKLLLIAITCIPFLSEAQVIPVPNGDFETPSSILTGNVQNWAGSWFESNSGDLVPEINFQITGTYSIRFVGAGASNVRTITTANAASFAVITGRTYKVTFNWRIQTAAGASGGVNTDANIFTARAIETSSDGTTNGAIINSTTTTSGTDVAGTFNFKVTSATPKIKLQFSKDGGIAYLDDVTLEDLGVLPITLSSFTGEAKDFGTKLTWTTASEVNNQYFELLRAGDDKNFASIGRINGAINSSESKTYSFSDFNPIKGNNYYQLKQVDIDGKSETFGPVAVKFGLAQESFNVLSTSASSVMVNISSSVAKRAEISYIGLDGRVLYRQQISLTSGLNTFSIPVDKSTGNIGIINFRTDGEQKSLKIAR
jgi:hypothetical protein